MVLQAPFDARKALTVIPVPTVLLVECLRASFTMAIPETTPLGQVESLLQTGM